MAVLELVADVLTPDPGGVHTATAPNRVGAVLRATRWRLPATTEEGDVGSTIQIATLPQYARYCGALSTLSWTAFGLGRTLEAGWLPYVLASGDEMPGDPAGLGTGLIVDAAGHSFLDALTLAPEELVFAAPVTIILTVGGDTIPVGTVLGGMLCWLSAY